MTIKQILEQAGATDIEGYCLVSNHGYTFSLNGGKYDARHWLNCYGADVDYWDVTGKNSKGEYEHLADLETKLNEHWLEE